MAYSDKYRKILDEILIDKIKLDGMLEKEEEEAILKVKGEALKEKKDPGAFVIPIRLKSRINLNALVDTGSEINVMPYRVYQKLGREEVKRINRDITMINHTKAKSMGMLKDVICQAGVTTILAKAAKIGLDTTESDSDDEEDYTIKRNKFGAPIYDSKPAYPFDCSNKTEQALELQTVINPLRKVYVWKKAVSFLGSFPVPLEHLE
ncbi:agenet domain-containing protein [Tanacetum coccineum]